MKLQEIASALGIAKYPEGMNICLETVLRNEYPACDLSLIDSLQLEFSLFGQYYDIVKETAAAINADMICSAWVKTAALYVQDKTVTQAREVPVPKPDGTQKIALLPLYILLPQIPAGIENYRNRGFSESEIRDIVTAYAAGIRIVESQSGMPGINGLYYYWLTLYTKAAIFNTHGLQFELRYAPNGAIYLKNKTDGQILMLAAAGKFHRSGVQVLGSAGYTDETGAFDAEFAEDETCFYGHAIINSCVENQRKAFSKNDWACILRPGDPCLSLHIPRGGDISVENMTKALEAARAIAKQRYPEHVGFSLFGSSWILDPKLTELLGENSKIAQMLTMFHKYPQKSGGTGIFGYVFPKFFDSLDTLPEDTSLQRKLKEFYINGGYIYDYAGFIL